jgi:hypothetical protein
MNRVSARLISLVLAMVLAAAPILPTICEWSCADGTHGSATTGDGHHHSDNDASVPGHGMAGDAMAPYEHGHQTSATLAGSMDSADSASCSVAMAFVPACCDHADSHVVSSAAVKIAIEPPAITPTVFDISDHLAASESTAVVTPLARQPVPLSLLTPLRV